MQWEKIQTVQIPTDPGLFGSVLKLGVLLSRSPVPGGWLVMAMGVSSADTPVSITFYPDPTHAWEIEKP